LQEAEEREEQTAPFFFSKMAKEFHYGGQAVIEGVMMQGRKAMVTVVRRPNGELASNVHPIPPVYSSWMRRVPLLRGVVVLIATLVLGMKSLFYSANVAVEEETEEISHKAILGMVASAVILVVALFFIAPLFLTKLVNPYLPNSLVFNIVEGVIRLVIFIVYLKVISLLPDIRRVFAYHGAEHKTVNAYEAGMPLEVSSIRSYSTSHVRCGTGFLFAVLIIAIVVFVFIGRPALWLMVLSRIVLIPVIAALGYEFVYFSARHAGNWLVRALMAPGLFLQSLTTGEPDDRQLETAIAALAKAIELDKSEEAPQPSS
jgi:uncharacterized protein YqhQ